MSDNAKTDYRARRMGFVFQIYNLLPVLSAVENVELPLLVSGVKQGGPRAGYGGAGARRSRATGRTTGRPSSRVASAARDDRPRPRQRPGDRLGGRAHRRPRQQDRREIIDLMRHLNQSARLTFVLVTHDRGVGERCNRIVRMRDGLIVPSERLEPAVVRRQ